MDKNRIMRPTRPDEQMIAKSAIIKSRGGKARAAEVIIRAAILARAAIEVGVQQPHLAAKIQFVI